METDGQPAGVNTTWFVAEGGNEYLQADFPSMYALRIEYVEVF